MAKSSAKKWVAVMEQYGEKACEAAKKALLDNAADLESSMKNSVPVKSGALKGSINTKRGKVGKYGLKVSVGAVSPYAKAIEFGYKRRYSFTYKELDPKREKYAQNVENAIRGVFA